MTKSLGDALNVANPLEAAQMDGVLSEPYFPKVHKKKDPPHTAALSAAKKSAMTLLFANIAGVNLVMGKGLFKTRPLNFKD